MTFGNFRAIRGRLPFALFAGFAVLASAVILFAAEKVDVGNLIAPQDIAVTVRPIGFSKGEPSRTQFGKLAFLSEAVLTSPSDYFGGYSALVLDQKGERFLALSDSGSWLAGRIDYDGGKIAGISDARIGATPDKNGQPLRKRDRDSESLVALAPGSIEGRYLIGFEGRHRIEEYAFEKGELRGPLGNRPLPDQLKGMKSNSGLEDLAVLRGGPFAGALVAFAEEKLSPEGHHTGALVIKGKSQPLFMTRHDEYDVTDMQSLEDGSLVVLERSFTPQTFRLGIRLRRIPVAEVKPGALLVGETLLEMGPEFEIDNFEGLALHKSASGDTILTLISDNNFNFFQRTLIAQFTLQQ